MIRLCVRNPKATRRGGEEFLFIIPDFDIGDGVEFTEKIHKALIAHVFDIADCQFGITMTFGVSTGLPVEKTDDIINRADERLYKGKKQRQEPHEVHRLIKNGRHITFRLFFLLCIGIC